jgi:hypothetical protein
LQVFDGSDRTQSRINGRAQVFHDDASSFHLHSAVIREMFKKVTDVITGTQKELEWMSLIGIELMDGGNQSRFIA